MKVTVIIPYKEDRGWLKYAVKSVPDDVQLLLSQGEGNWPQNFNKAFPQAKGDFIKFLHEDDIIPLDGIKLAAEGLALSGADFIHGNAYEMWENGQIIWTYKPHIQIPTIMDLIRKNVIHSTTLMYRREVVEKLGGFDESPGMWAMEELEFNLRALDTGFKIGYVEQTIGCYRRHPKQIIRTTPHSIRRTNKVNLINRYVKERNTGLHNRN